MTRACVSATCRIAAVLAGVSGTCAAQVPESLAPTVLKSGTLATPAIFQPAFARGADGYLERVAPSGRRTFHLRAAQPNVVDAVLATGMTSFSTAGLPRVFAFDLDGEQAIVFRTIRYEKRETLDVWAGNATLYLSGVTMKRAGGSGPANIVVKNGLIMSGSAYMAGAGPFLIEGLGENLLAVREADPKRFYPEARFLSIGGGGQRRPKVGAAIQPGKPQLRVAIYFTRAAEREVLRFPGNGQTIRSVIASEVETLRRSLFDAGVNVALKILPTNDGAPTNYVEKDAIEDDVLCLSKQELDCQPMLREAAHAVILVRSMRKNVCGSAAHDGSEWRDQSLSVAVVGWNCISNLQHGLVHELGHLLGAQHENGAGKGTYAFAKAYITPDAKRGTLVSRMRPGMLRLPYWSSPKQPDWLDHPIGNDKQNNALALSQNVPQVIANFEQ